MTDSRLVVLLAVDGNDWYVKMNQKWFLRKNGWNVDEKSAVSPTGIQFQVIFEGPSRVANDVKAGLVMMNNHIKTVANKQQETV